MNKYTEGPWIVTGESWEGDGTAGVLVETESGQCIAFCTSWTDRGVPDKAQPADYENAKLISAAPELLEALEKLVSACAQEWIMDEFEVFEAPYAIAVAAIAKARGLQP